MSSPTYVELLKHPLWQRKRLEILQRNDFKCEDCGSSDRTLHIHHGYYEKGLKPWEYPDASLHALCDECHRAEQDVMTEVQRAIGLIALADMAWLLGYLKGLRLYGDENAVVEIGDDMEAIGIGHVFGLTGVEVIRAMVERTVDGATLLALQKK